MNDLVPDRTAPVEFVTGRMVLRSLAESDATLFCDLYTDPEIMHFIGTPLSLQRALKSFRAALQLTQQRPIESLFLTVVDKIAQQGIGICSIELRGSKAEVGIILRADSRAGGRAKEALGGTVALAFSLLPLDAVIVRISAGHRAAERLVVGLGLSRRAAVMDHDAKEVRRIWSIDRSSWDYAQRTLHMYRNLHGLREDT